ncbi:MAG: baseplate J/gp47 family protein [Alphaproteobacteria bacterium]|nr:baseplate J/gp47 family protein [Alphaproteobacteria bacterium]
MGDILPSGFKGTTENEYFEKEKALYLSIDSDWNLDPSVPDGLKLAADAETFVTFDELGQTAYNSKDPGKAKDLELDIIGSLTNSKRDQGSPSTVALTLGGVNGTIIAAGKQVGSGIDGTVWETLSQVTIVGGVAAVSAQALVNGSTQADIGTLTEIIDTVGGWQTVTNNTVAQPGTNVETNPEFRLRRSITVGAPGNNMIDSMLGSIGNIDGVGLFAVYENFTSFTDTNGVPGHSMAIIVQGGTDEDVAKAIFIKKNPGGGLFGAGVPVVVNVVSSVHPTNDKDITFGRPTLDDVAVVVNIINDGSLVASTEQDVKDAIIEYAIGTLLVGDAGFNTTGFDIGEDVAVSRLYTPINSVIGALGGSYITSTTVNGVSSIVSIDFDTLSNWLDENIIVSIV